MQLIEEKSGPIASCYDIKGVFLDFCVGPHVPSVGKLGHFKLTSTSSAYWKGDAKNQPMQRVYGTAFFSKGELEQYLNRLEEAKKRDHRKLGKDLGLFHVPPVGAGRGVLAGQGHDRLPHHRQLHARRAAAERLRRAEDAAGVQQGAVGDLRPLAALPPEHVPHRQRRGADGHEGHELPRPHARLRQRDAQLSRPAAALPRADAAAPQRGVRRDVGADPRPPVLAGRRALLRDGVADRRGSRAPAPPRAARLRRLRPRVQRQAVDAAGRVPRRDRDLGPRRGRAEARARERRPGLHGRRGRRRLLRPEDRLRRHRRDRPEVAVRDRAARLPAAAALRPEVHRRGQRRAPAGGHPPRHLRQLRAVHGAADRALRRGVPAVAGARPGDRAAALGPAPRRRQGRGGHARGGRPAGHGRRAGREDRVQDSGSSAPADSVHAGAG